MSPKPLLLTCLLIALALAFSPSLMLERESGGEVFAQDDTPLPHFEIVACDPTTAMSGDTYCGTLTVLENRAKPDGNTIDLEIEFLPATGPNPQPDPIVFLAGGRGFDGTGLFLLTNSAASLRFNRHILLLQMRGAIGASPELMCLDYGPAVAAAYMSDLPPAEAVKPAAAVLLSCYENLKAQGVDVNAYNIAEIAADLEDMRVAVGIEKMNLYGASYGTAILLEVMRNYSDGLRAVGMESINPPTASFFTDASANFAHALYGSFAECAANPDCAADYPDPEATLFEVVDRLNETPLEFEGYSLDEPFRLNGRAYLFTLQNGLIANYYLHNLPSIAYANLNGDFALIESAAQSHLPSWNKFANVLQYVMQCSARVPYESLADIEAQAATLDPRLADLMLMDAYLTWEICAGMADVNSAAPEAVTSDVPTLLLSGEYDPVMPPAYAELALQTLSQAQHFVVPLTAHTPVISSGCGLLMIEAFFDNPTAPVEMECN